MMHGQSVYIINHLGDEKENGNEMQIRIKNAIRQINIRNIFKYPKQFRAGKRQDRVRMTAVLWHSCDSRRIYWNTALAAGSHRKNLNSRIYLPAEFTYWPLAEIGKICHVQKVFFE